MSFWNQFFNRNDQTVLLEKLHTVNLKLEGWHEEKASRDMRIWRDSQEDVISLTIVEKEFALPNLSNEKAIQQWSRSLAESRSAGLIEVSAITSSFGDILALIYKRLEKPAYIFTGMLIIPSHYQVWTVVCGEHGVTGEREAIITAELINAGKLSIQEYEVSWACDPYDRQYRGVDKSVLRFVSDDKRYDEYFPNHPLSKLRQIVEKFPKSIQIESLQS